MDELDVEVEGEGSPVVFIHGWLGSKNSWNHVRSHLEIDGKKVFYSQICHGESSCKKFSMKDLSHDLKNIVDELDLRNPVLVGHSMGGMTALKYASMYENFSGLLLLATCASTPEPENESPQYFLEKFEEIDRRKWAESITENYLSRDVDAEIWEGSIKELEEEDYEPIIYGLESMIDYDVRNEIKDLEKPCRVVSASEDGAITRDKSQELADSLDAEIDILDCGHLLLHEKPGETAGIIEEFVSGIQ